ncbi:MAG TPA: A24 family peptidase C-terminal domain-containing protein, partial [Candidatus Thermoplasmatota archaeon]|nr:A24 family peptidase C-terminal domain-containing protein [Candidatus Thermoplasmatota archaeon]
MLPLLDLLRLFLGASVLAFASYTDWRWRRAPNVLWLILAGAGLALLAVEALLDGPRVAARWPYLVAAPALITLVYGLWWTGLIAGGADAKALMALALLLPFPVVVSDALPLWPAPMPGGFTVLGNSLLLFLAIPLSFAAWNLAHGDLRFPHLVLGVKRRARDVRRGHQWPMEVVDEAGARRTKLFASRMTDEEIEASFERVQALGDERVWVSPKVPFMIPLLAGFLCAFFLGDLLMALMARVVPAP